MISTPYIGSASTDETKPVLYQLYVGLWNCGRAGMFYNVLDGVLCTMQRDAGHLSDNLYTD